MRETRRDLLGSLLPLTRALRRIEDDAAAAHGLTMWQYAVLSVVAVRPDVNQREVAELIGYSRNRIVADLDLLEEQALITRRPGADRRANLLRSTPAGLVRMRRVRADLHAGEDALLAGLPAQLRRDLDEVAVRVADHLR